MNLNPFDDGLSDASSQTSYPTSEESLPDLFSVTESVTLKLVLVGSYVQARLEVEDPWLGLGGGAETEQPLCGRLSVIAEEEESEGDEKSECDTIGAHFGAAQDRADSCSTLEWSLGELKRRVQGLMGTQDVKQGLQGGAPPARNRSKLQKVWSAIKSKMLCGGGCTGVDD